MTINERVRAIRNALNLTQKEFGQKLTLAQTYLSQIEKGDRVVTEKIQKLICFEFNVNEDWLKNGSGEIFASPATTFIDNLIEKYDLDVLDRKILESYAKLDNNKKQTIKDFILDIAKSYENEQSKELSVFSTNINTAPAQSVETKPEPQNDTASIDAEVEAYRLELLAEAKGKTSLASDGASMHEKNA